MFLLESIKTGLDILFTFAFGAGLIYLVLQFTYKKIEKDGFGRGIYFGVLALIEAGFVFLVIYIFPIWFAREIEKSKYFDSIQSNNIRWILLYLIIIPLWWLITKKHSGQRGMVTSLLVLTIFLFGWQYDRWIGIFFISIPILGIFLFLLDKLAQVLFPAIDPGDKKERWQKTKAFIGYMVGLQYPVWMAKFKASRDFDMRISGDLTNSEIKPGIVWTWSHQAAALSTGIEFTRVDGPGTVFTNQYERPISVVDLRTQLRVNVLEAVTSDGIKIPAVVFMAYGIDRDNWPKEEWSPDFSSIMKYNYSNDYDIDHEGIYPFSSNRIRVALSNMGINVSTEEPSNDLYWDEWVRERVSQAAQQVISTRSLDEMWRPRNDGPGESALDEMAGAIKEILAPQLVRVGINLFAARIVNFGLNIDNEYDYKIIKKQIDTWSTKWDQKITQVQAETEAIYREEIDNAHAFAKSVLLDAVAESLAIARGINPELPKHVIAQYYIYALEEYIKKQPGMDQEDAKERIENLKNFLLFSRTEGGE